MSNIEYTAHHEKEQITLRSAAPVMFFRFDLEVAEEIFATLGNAIKELKENNKNNE